MVSLVDTSNHNLIHQNQIARLSYAALFNVSFIFDLHLLWFQSLNTKWIHGMQVCYQINEFTYTYVVLGLKHAHIIVSVWPAFQYSLNHWIDKHVCDNNSTSVMIGSNVIPRIKYIEFVIKLWWHSTTV